MTTSLVPQSRKTIDRAKALNCLLVNQFATPGLGSLMAGRVLEGIVQLLLAVAGFCCVVGWFAQIVYATYRQMNEHRPASLPSSWLGKIGFILFIASWLLSWITSLSVLRTASKNEAANPPKLPPPKIR
ncbi:MAG: hypothetical protein JWQ71_1581 [Pedosphaera sp.]|nr:hypothetical protein [Pedosphaera sp.]